MEPKSPNQEEKNAKVVNTYSPEERRLAELFFDSIEPYEKLKYSDSNRHAPLDLGERLLNGFETFNQSFRLFLNEIGYYEKEVIYNLILRLLADKINSISNPDIGTDLKRTYKVYFEYYYAQLEKMKPDVKFNLSWNKHNKYFLPLVVEALCETKIIAESNRTALDAFQFIFPKEKLQKLNIDNAYRSAFIAEDATVFVHALDALLNDIRSNLIKTQEEKRQVYKLEIEKKKAKKLNKKKE
jgi:hypothetical protein